jgi:hypothetical protein
MAENPSRLTVADVKDLINRGQPVAPLILVEAVRAACLDAALLAYEDAGIRGLCADGRWEAALAAIRHLDLSGVLGRPAGSAHVDETPSG